MGNNNPRWRGSRDIQQAPTSPQFENTQQGPKYTLTYGGPYDSLLAAAPARLSTVGPIGNFTFTGFFVDTVHVDREKGATGIMTITLTPNPIADYTFGENGVLEVEWVMGQRKLEDHPRWHPGSDTNRGPLAGQNTIDPEGWQSIREWKDASPDQQGTLYSTADESVKAYLDLVIAGTDSYEEFNPVVRLTTYHASPPQTNPCGVIQDPPQSVQGYVFLKTADRSTRTRTWTRIEEWTGAERIAGTLYARG